MLTKRKGYSFVHRFVIRDVQNRIAADVAGHDDDCIAEINGTSLAIGESTIIKHL